MGLNNAIYYSCEIILYRHPLGILLLVVASLSSTFFVGPIQILLRLGHPTPTPALAYALGIGGTALSLMEPAAVQAIRRGASKACNVLTGATAPATKVEDTTEQPAPEEQESAPLLGESAPYVSKQPAPPMRPRRSILWTVLIPFFTLWVVEALYMVLQLLFNDRDRVNVWGFTSFDQMSLPFVLIPVCGLFASQRLGTGIAPASSIPVPCATQGAAAATDDAPAARHPSVILRLGATISSDLRAVAALPFAAHVDSFIYRLFANAKAILYFYFSVRYDLSVVYLQLCLIKIALGWVASLLIAFTLPGFIAAGQQERQATLQPGSLLLRSAGTLLLLISLGVTK
jgi:hypothetical protein